MDTELPKVKTEDAKTKGNIKIDPSFKSKRYRDKLRAEVKALELLVPVDKPALHRKLDSQTVYRLAIAFLRLKAYFQDKGLSKNGSGCSERIKDDNNPSEKSTSTKPNKDEIFTDTDNKVAFEELNLSQLFDGFLLVASVDGTIMFVSDNVQQITGFSQVDLTHRCFYGTLHPDDQTDVRDILEQNGTFAFRQQLQGTKPSRKRPRTKLLRGESREPVPLAFFCRMKCFSANTAGYLKLHCTGKIEATSHLPRSAKTSDRVILLYCRPFLVTGCDVSNDVKQNVFWSKHDLDLTIKDIEAKCSDIIGYDHEELQDKSLYQYVHPEDLCIVTHVHRSIMEVNDVQSFYFRFHDKDGGWKWLLSKGKVICKNSKKFSVVFTHCPLRDVDNTFLRQESILRRKYGLTDLLNMCAARRSGGQLGHVVNHFDGINSYIHNFGINNANIKRQVSPMTHDASSHVDSSCCHGNSEVASIFSTLVSGPCPSTWHANADRHSPVVPSSHVAHKLSLRERQLQLAEFRRKQEQQQYGCVGDLVLNRNGVCNKRTIDRNYNHQVNNSGNCWPQYADYRPHMQQKQQQQQRPDMFPPDSQHAVYRYPSHEETGSDVNCFRYVNFRLSEPYHYPPSPPPSPQTKLSPWYHVTSQPEVTRNITNDNVQSTPHGVIHQHNGYFPSTPRAHTGPLSPSLKRFVRARADVKVSMMYCQRAEEDSGIIMQRNCSTSQCGPTDNRPCNGEKFKDELNASKFSCAVMKRSVPSRNVRTCEFETSMHMQIVESESNSTNSVPELPLTGSFMDYLNSA